MSAICVRNLHYSFKYKPILGKVAVCTWADGSWANRTCCKSQGAYLTAYVDETFLTGIFGHVNVAMFASKKLPRVARSSTAMEVQCVAVGHEETEHVRAAWTWLHYLGEPKVLDSSSYISLASQIPGTVITDSKGLYDALAKSQSSALGLKDDRKSAIECLALRQCMSQTSCLIRWVHSEAMVVDGMTQ